MEKLSINFARPSALFSACVLIIHSNIFFKNKVRLLLQKSSFVTFYEMCLSLGVFGLFWQLGNIIFNNIWWL